MDRRLAALVLPLTLTAVLSSASTARDMSTDRPDATESPIPVDPGRWQLELDALAWTDFASGARTLQAAVINLKRGLAPQTDVQFLLTPLTFDRAPDVLGGESDVAPASLGIRLKHNLWGADGGRTALALLPFATIQVGGEGAGDAWVAGLAVPVAADLGSGFGGGAMIQAASVHDGEGRTSIWTTTATVGHAVSGPLSAYVEFIASTSSRAFDLVSTTASFGVTVRPSDDLQLDAGVRTGLVRDESTVVFLGLSARR